MREGYGRPPTFILPQESIIMSTSEEQGVEVGQQLGRDVEVMLGDPLTISIDISPSATVSLRGHDAEYLSLSGASYQGPNPGQEQAQFITRFDTQRQGRTTVQYTLAPNPLNPLVVLVQYNVTIIGF
jgi:hypothetical protein